MVRAIHVVMMTDAGHGDGGRLQCVAQRNTLEANPATTVLMVGGPQALIDCTQRAARSVQPLRS